MFVSELVSTDAKILLGMDPATKMRVRSLLLKNASEIKVGSYSFLKLRSPARNVAMMLHTLGEKDLLADYGGLVDAVVKFCPYEGEFIDLIRGSKKSSR
jgi:hypothetical protein